jgi:CheY-like chemotaxis protein
MKNIKRVLIVEDDPYVRELEKALFERADYTVFDAGEAIRGITIAVEEKPDVIVLDLQLPKIDGLQAAQILKNHPKTKNIPCIIVTASATDDQLEEIKSSDACGYVIKPINTRTFVEQVIALTGNAKFVRV